MPTNITDVSQFTDPATSPADGDADSGATFLASFQKIANRTRFLLDKALGGVTSWPVNRVISVDITRGKAFGTCVLAPGDMTALGHVVWSIQTDHDEAIPTGCVLFPIGDLIRSGQSLLAVTAIMKPGTTRATAANRTQLLVVRQPHVYATASADIAGVQAILGSATDDGTATGQKVAVTGLAHTISRGDGEYYVLIFGGNDAFTHNDLIYGLALSISDVGPRQG